MDLYVEICSVFAAAMSLIALAAVRSDKRRAKEQRWRIPERHFLLLALLGGGAGVLAGFFLFRHKTRHLGLMAGVAALTALCYGALIAARFLLW